MLIIIIFIFFPNEDCDLSPTLKPSSYALNIDFILPFLPFNIFNQPLNDPSLISSLLILITSISISLLFNTSKEQSYYSIHLIY